MRRSWRLYGLTLATDYPLESRLLPAEAEEAGAPAAAGERYADQRTDRNAATGREEPRRGEVSSPEERGREVSRREEPCREVTFTCGERPPPAVDPAGGERLFASRLRNAEGESVSYLDGLGGAFRLRLTGGADFYLLRRRIHCHLWRPDARPLVELGLLGTVLAFWLERSGRPALHASAVEVGGRAVAFLAGHRSGKSSLAAAFLAAGHRLLSDDLLAVEEDGAGFHGLPGYPQMRLWPEQAEHFCGRSDDLPAVHPAVAKRRLPVGAGGFGRFCSEARPLAALYLPRRRRVGEPATVAVESLAPRDALIELLRLSFAPHLPEAAGLQPGRLERFARLVEAVPVRRLSYPPGYDRLEQVVAVVQADLPGAPPASPQVPVAGRVDPAEDSR